MFAIDHTDPLPIYAQLDRAIRLAVATGKLRRGDQLPTVRQLAVDLRINANTVAKVYAELRASRKVNGNAAKVGTFIEGFAKPGGFACRTAGSSSRTWPLSFFRQVVVLGFTEHEAIEFINSRPRQRKQEQSDG